MLAHDPAGLLVAVQAEGVDLTLLRDPAGRVTGWAQEGGAGVGVRRDPLGLVVEEQGTDTLSLRYTSRGALERVDTSVGAWSWSYDAAGHTLQVDHEGWSYGRLVDVVGRRTLSRLPSGTVTLTAWEGLTGLSRVDDAGGRAQRQQETTD